MRIERLSWSKSSSWSAMQDGLPADLILYFGSRATLLEPLWYEQLKDRAGDAQLVGCSTASHIIGNNIVDDGIAGVALRFAGSRVRTSAVEVSGPSSSRADGAALGWALAGDDLAGVLVLSDGLRVNGSELTRGIASEIGEGVSVSGGLAADGALFEETLVGLNERPRRRRIVAVGFYGAARISTGSAGGWAGFGPRRGITRAEGNVLHALDDEPALDLYERYLGAEDSQALPSSALLYPLKIFDPDHPEHSVVRTVLAVDRLARTMTFAGDVPQGWQAQLMRGSVDRLTEGAIEAARQVAEQHTSHPEPALALIVSCIGRQLLMGQRTVDEVEAAGAELGDTTVRLGFYSYGEICPHPVSGRGEMHNQTMTITAISETVAR